MQKHYMKQSPDAELNVGGYGGGNVPAPTKVPPPPVAQPQTPAPAEASGDSDNLDSYGYEIVPTAEEKKEAAAPVKKEEGKAPEIKEPVAGYGKDPIKEEPVVAAAPVVQSEIKLDYEVDGKDLTKEEIETVRKFAADQKLPKEAAQALIDLRKKENDFYKAEVSRIETEQKQKIATQKASWDKELREDPTFGGENFAYNLARADKVLTTLMPDTKKALTERKSMLPPYVMRDLVRVHNQLYGTDSLVQGDVHVPETETKASSPLDFYE